MSRLGTGPILGFRVEPTGEPKEETLRGAFLQALLHHAQDDNAGEFALLNHRPGDGDRAIAELLAWEILRRHADLAEEHAPGESALDLAEAEGYVYMLPTIESDVERQEKTLGPSTVTKGVNSLQWDWPTGELMVFESHPIYPFLWKDVTAEEVALLEVPLEQPAWGAVEKLKAIGNAGRPHVFTPDNDACTHCACGLSLEEHNEERVDATPVGECVAELREQVLAQDTSPCDGGTPGEQEPSPGVGSPEDLEAEAVAVARHTMHLAKAELAQGLWDRFELTDPQFKPVTWCCSCAKTIKGAPTFKHDAGGVDLWAHARCVAKEVALLEEERETKAAAAIAVAELPRAQQLAQGAKNLKPFAARHRPYRCRACRKTYDDAPARAECPGCSSSVAEENPCCELCLQAIKRGDLVRRKSKTSDKRMHDTCVRAELNKTEEVTT